MNSASDHKHNAQVYMAEARAEKNKIHPEWRSKLVKWARDRWHEYLKEKRRGQSELF